jgi:hypothetical protein
MAEVNMLMGTGLPELDTVIQGIRPGDNIVWQVNSIDDYVEFVHPFCRDAYSKGKKILYFRFAAHQFLIPEGVEAEVHELNPEEGFESFISDIFRVIEKEGLGAFYVFDSLSELTVDWYSDMMLANFFMLTCPYLYDYDTVTYFALFRNRHSAQTVGVIHDTAQVIIDIYKHDDELYIHPLKVDKRYTKTMYLLHHWKEGLFHPVTNSSIISEILKDVPHPWLDFSISQMDHWNRVFAQAESMQESCRSGTPVPEEYDEYFQKMLRMLITRDERALELAGRYFNMDDLIDIGRHMIGSGLIGGKALGMLLARAVLRESDPELAEKLEPHDSFFIGSDVFYTYLIKSNSWWPRWRQRSSENYLEGREEVHDRLMSGAFPDDIKDHFMEILNYYGQSPIIVRSSSLLEDAYGNSFSGKYESVFCANQGTPEERLQEFMDAVRKVYASTMNQDALLYRQKRGLLYNDEQMALLVQRVSGTMYGDYHFPQAAGVGFSYNLYAWDKDIDPKAGVLRLVFGLGTRAVDRHDDDYTRVVAINVPQKRPEADFDALRKYAQRKVDVINLGSNSFETGYFTDVVKDRRMLPLDLFASRDPELVRHAEARGKRDIFPYIITFDGLFRSTDFIKDIGRILHILQEAYAYPVDIEFAANFFDGGRYMINLLQCRPYQVKKGVGIVSEPKDIPDNRLVLKTSGPIIGSSVHSRIDRLIYVVPSEYGKLPEKDRYAVAKLIGKIVGVEAGDAAENIMLLGPGRWATTTPALGVPVSFREINRVSVLCELAEMHEGLVPDVSLGTHFFNDLVELDILYMALYPDRSGNHINRDFLATAENRLAELIPTEARWEDTVRVIDHPPADPSRSIFLVANSVDQRAICYLDVGKKE